jgi:hypothetical protein
VGSFGVGVFFFGVRFFVRFLRFFAGGFFFAVVFFAVVFLRFFAGGFFAGGFFGVRFFAGGFFAGGPSFASSFSEVSGLG